MIQPLNRRPELDGLRGIAVALVLGYHGFGDVITGGWLGVDVFFVLSGFLMGLLLLPQVEAGFLEWKDFLVRRLRRLFPALVTTVGVISLLAWLLLSGEAFRQFSVSALAGLGFGSNVFFWQNSGYFDTPFDERPLLHLWSVSLEGQFYVFLVVLLLVALRWGRGSLRPLLWSSLLVSLTVSLSGVFESSTTFFLLPTRVWEFLAGVVLADAIARQPRLSLPESVPTALGTIGAGVVVAWGLFAESSQYSAWSSVAVTLGTLAVITGSHFSAVLARLLSTPALVGAGLISYSLYLWHWPLLVLGREFFIDFGALQVALILVVSVGISFVTWRFIEQPFRGHGVARTGSPKMWLGISTASLSMGLLAAGSGILGPSGLKWQTISIPGYVVGGERAQADRWDLIRENGGGTGPDCGDGDDDHSGWIDAADPRPGLVVIGNSHARDLYNVLAQSDEASARYQVGKMSCQLVDMLFHPGFIDSETYRRAEIVIISSRYSDIDVAALPQILERLLADGKTVAIAAAFPDINIDTPRDWMWIDRLTYHHQSQRDNPDVVAERVNRDAYGIFEEADIPFDAEVREVAAQYGLPVIDRVDYICDDDLRECAVLSDSLWKHFYDESHHSLVGAAYFAERVDQVRWLGPIEKAR